MKFVWTFEGILQAVFLAIFFLFIIGAYILDAKDRLFKKYKNRKK